MNPRIITDLWNAAAKKPERQPEPREYVYASEIGGPFVDRFLKMKGTEYTNPPNQRSLRKFLAGDIWQFVVKQVLIACGIGHEEELTANCSDEGVLDVHGRMDFRIEGRVQDVFYTPLPEFMKDVALNISEALIGWEFPPTVIEVKSVSSFAFEALERTGAFPRHLMQTYHYAKCLDLPASLFYVCKDDCRIREFSVGEDCRELYLSDLTAFTKTWNAGEVPPPEPLVKLEAARFSKNLAVEYSPYLTMIYGFETPETYRDAVSFTEKWNRVTNRYAAVKMGKTTPKGNPIKITAANEEIRDEIMKAGYDFDGIVTIKTNLNDIEDES